MFALAITLIVGGMIAIAAGVGILIYLLNS